MPDYSRRYSNTLYLLKLGTINILRLYASISCTSHLRQASFKWVPNADPPKVTSSLVYRFRRRPKKGVYECPTHSSAESLFHGRHVFSAGSNEVQGRQERRSEAERIEILQIRYQKWSRFGEQGVKLWRRCRSTSASCVGVPELTTLVVVLSLRAPTSTFRWQLGRPRVAAHILETCENWIPTRKETRYIMLISSWITGRTWKHSLGSIWPQEWDISMTKLCDEWQHDTTENGILSKYRTNHKKQIKIDSRAATKRRGSRNTLNSPWGTIPFQG